VIERVGGCQALARVQLEQGVEELRELHTVSEVSQNCVKTNSSKANRGKLPDALLIPMNDFALRLGPVSPTSLGPWKLVPALHILLVGSAA
jgi:hypothetical protein